MLCIGNSKAATKFMYRSQRGAEQHIPLYILLSVKISTIPKKYHKLNMLAVLIASNA